MPSSSLLTTEAPDADAADDDADADIDEDKDDEPGDEDDENKSPNMAKNSTRSAKGASKSAPTKRGKAKTTGDDPIFVDTPPPRGRRTTPSNGRRRTSRRPARRGTPSTPGRKAPSNTSTSSSTTAVCHLLERSQASPSARGGRNYASSGSSPRSSSLPCKPPRSGSPSIPRGTTGTATRRTT